MNPLRVVTCTGRDLQAHLADIARLRIDVFRDWPYLYAGDSAYEQRYLQTYVDTPDAMVAICFDGERVVGASTALPLAAETEEITRPFRAGAQAGTVPLHLTLYLGESVLDARYRGRGIGLEFFAQREAHAIRLGLSHCVFCAVQREPDDARRPPGYVPLDAFWRKRGFAPLASCTTTLRWQEIGEAGETPKPMQFWHKQVGG